MLRPLGVQGEVVCCVRRPQGAGGAGEKPDEPDAHGWPWS